MGVRRYASCLEIAAIHTNSQNEFWKRVRKEGVSIRYVPTDMSSAFAKSVRENAPDVFDHFHVIKLMNDTLDKIRRELVSREVDPAKRRLIKGSRFLLLANSENIVNHNGMSKLQLALEVNKPLVQAYCLKEYFRQVYTRKHHFCREEREPRMVSWKALYNKGRRHQY